MEASVLVVEDEPEIAELIELYFKQDGARVTIAGTGDEAVKAFSEGEFDVVLLDINLPGTDGFEVLSAIRSRAAVPVIVVSAREADEDQIYALGIGADEYVTKPFSPKVLVARTRALLRRQSEPAKAAVRFGSFSLDLDSYLLRRDGERVSLSAKEFDVLAALVRAEGKPLRSEEIYAAAWDNEFGDITTVGVYIKRLRAKIEDDPQNPRYIETIHGKGYRFAAELVR